LRHIYHYHGKNYQRAAEGDISDHSPGELHELIAPEEGERRILLFDFSLISNLKGLSNILTILSQPRLITPTTTPDIYDKLSNLFHELTSEYQSKNTLREEAIYALIIQMLVVTGRKYMNTENLFLPSRRITSE
jgi:hypothetical protein